MADTINNAIPFVPENTIDPAAGLNLSINTIDALLQVLVQTVGANTPPVSPANGTRYIVGTSPTGTWAGQANKLARYLDSAWQFFDARYALNADDGLWYVRSASTWAPIAGGGGGEVNTASNLGVGEGVFASKVGVDLQFKSLIAGANVTLTSDGDEITIDATGGGGGATLPVVQALSSSRSLTLADANTFNVNSTSSAYTATIPAQSSVAWAADTEIHFLRSGTGAITITAAAGVSINGVTAASVTMAVQNGAVTIKRVGSDAWWLGGLTEVTPPTREKLTADRTYYVRTDGSDSNSGLVDSAGGAFLTIQRAVNAVSAIDLGNFNITVRVRAGTYDRFILRGYLAGTGRATLEDLGGVVEVLAASGLAAINAQGGIWAINNFKVSGTGNGVQASGAGTSLSVRGFDFGAVTAPYTHVVSSGLAVISFGSANYTISGSAVSHLYTDSSAQIQCNVLTCTLTGTPAFSGPFARAGNLSLTRVVSVTFTGSATGIRYTALSNGVVDVSGAGATYLPGDAAGSVSTGGQYV